MAEWLQIEPVKKPLTKQENLCVGRKWASTCKEMTLVELHLCFWRYPRQDCILSSCIPGSWAWVTWPALAATLKTSLLAQSFADRPDSWGILSLVIWVEIDRSCCSWDPCKQNPCGRGKIRSRCDHHNLKNKTKQKKGTALLSPLANIDRAETRFPSSLTSRWHGHSEWAVSILAQRELDSLQCFLWKYMFLEQPFWFENKSG